MSDKLYLDPAKMQIVESGIILRDPKAEDNAGDFTALDLMNLVNRFNCAAANINDEYNELSDKLDRMNRLLDIILSSKGKKKKDAWAELNSVRWELDDEDHD